MADVTIDVRNLNLLARDLKRADAAIARQFPKGLKLAAEIVATAARQIAGGFSSRIPGSIKVMGGARVRVRAGGDSAPHAAPFEHSGRPGTFRHPVFGNREVWVSQQAHPFLRPAEEQTAPAFMAAITSVVDNSLRQVGI